MYQAEYQLEQLSRSVAFLLFPDYQKSVGARQQLDGQLNENTLVKEVGIYLDGFTVLNSLNG